MKTTTLMPTAAGWGTLWLLLLTLLALPGRAQFAATPDQSDFVCNAPGNQLGVQAFADGAGGSFVVWIDARNGNHSGAGTGIYAQHLNAQGVPQLAANGLKLYQTKGREVWFMRAIPWNDGMLVAWVQGGFGIGGDTLRCQYYNAAGAAQWKQPTLVGSTVKSSSFTVIYVGVNGINLIPTSTGGAIVTFSETVLYGGDDFAFNEVGKTGALRYALHAKDFPVEVNYYFHTIADGSDGFYMVGSTGGLGDPIKAQRFDASGSFAWKDYTTIVPQGGAGRSSDWHLLTGPANNLYVGWTSNGGDPLVSKVLTTGALAWAAPGYAKLSTHVSHKFNPDIVWQNNAVWMVWEDDYLPNTYASYAQQVDATGKLVWSADGVLVSSLPAGYPRPKLAVSDNNSVMAFFSAAYGEGFRAQKLLPTGTLAFAADGVPLSTVDVDKPNYLDYVPVSEPNGSVQVYWASPGSAPTGQDILAGRVQRTGTLLSTTEQAAARLGFAAYPNPARTELRLQLPAGATATDLRLYDAQGRLAATFAPAARLALPALAPGLYVLRATVAGQAVSERVAVE